MEIAPLIALLFFSTCPPLLAWAYFQRYRMQRPPIGVINLTDVIVILGFVALMPYIYFLLPLWFVAGLFALMILSVLYFLFQPILHVKWLIWLVVISLLILSITTRVFIGATSQAFLIANNATMILVVVGVTNMWVQGGMRARDAAILAGALCIYDFVATTQMTLMADTISRLSDMPFAPQVAWPVWSEGGLMSLGLGDLLLSALFPLVMRKAFGRLAGVTALLMSAGSFGLMFVLAYSGVVTTIFPAMVLLGPLMISQYLYWRRKKGKERPMHLYRLSKTLTAAPFCRDTV